MPAKRELLEEKTVKELKQMSRDKNISSYHDMKKSELIELVGDNYGKDEIKKWPNLGLKRIGRGERVVEEKEEEEETSVSIEEVEVEERFIPKSGLVFKLLVISSATASVFTIIALYFYF